MTKLPLFEAHDGGKVSATVRTSSLIFCCKSGVKYSGFISCHFWHVLQPLCMISSSVSHLISSLDLIRRSDLILLGSLIKSLLNKIIRSITNLKYKAQISEERSPKEYCTWQEVEVLVEKLAHTIQRSGKKYDVILAITNGGIIPARLIARELDINHIQFVPIRNKKLHVEEMLPLLKGRKYLVIDDIYDTGDTFSKVFDVVKEFDCDFAFLMTRYKDGNFILAAKILNHEKWIVFPWERKRY